MKVEIPQSLMPIQNEEAEISALGAMLLSEQACLEVQGILSEKDFYHPAHREIFRSILNLLHKNSAVDLVTLKNDLLEREQLINVGGLDYLIHIAESVPSAANAQYYAQIVLDKSTERNLESAAHNILKIVRESDNDTQQKVNQAEQMVFEVGRNRIGKYFAHVKGLARGFFDEVDRLMDTGQPVLGIPSGYYDLDEMTGGFYPGDFSIVAARPSMGKTAFVLNIALNIAKKKEGNVAVFSLEMGANQLVRRMCSTISGVGMGTLKRTNLDSKSYDRLADACETLYNAPIYIDDTSDISPLELQGKCRRLKQEGGLSLIVVDYLQLMRSSRRVDNRAQEISEIARSLKSIAKQLDVPLIALSQLNRGVEAREDKRPMLSDLRESGSIEAEADLVAFIYRDAYYKSKEVNNAENPYDPNAVEEAEIIISKHRNGPTGKVILGFQPSCVRFSNLHRS
jgi:replicative DNA helicase